MTLFSPYRLGNKVLRNRIVFPPVVCFGFTDDNGMVTQQNIDHYARRSDHGPGLIITEATCIRKDGRAAPGQLGIWSDDHISGLAKIAGVVKANGAVSLIQLHHAGLMSPESISPKVKGPSADINNPRNLALLPDEIEEIARDFMVAGIRAKTAGFDGVEIHGAHGYLLGQFASTLWNKRDDAFGGPLENRMKLAINIIRGIRESCGKDFLIGYRLGANAPSLDDGIAIACLLEQNGIDYLHVSHGGSLANLPRPPKDFNYNWIVYSGVVIKKSVDLPVIVVNEIKTAVRAEWLLINGHADLVALGRPLLADPFFVKNLIMGLPVNPCFSCKPKCKWYESAERCPAHKAIESSR